VGPVLDRVPEQQDEPGEALESNPEAEHDRQPPVRRQGGGRSALGPYRRHGVLPTSNDSITTKFTSMNESEP
jgi:hypothetical protein